MSMIRFMKIGVILITPLLAACQTKVLGIKPFASGGEGAPYALRFTQFDVTVKWRVTSCGRRTARAGEAANSIENLGFTMLAEVLAEPSFPEDPSRRWLLDLRSLDGWINSTDLTVNYEGGKFKSFNAVVEDKTADTVAAAAGAAVKIAALGLPVAASLAPDACADFVEAARVAKEKTESDTAGLSRAKTEFVSAQARGVSAASLQKLEAAVRLATDKLTASAAELEKALKVVTYEQKLKWPKHGSDGPSTSIPVPREALARWKWSADRWPDAPSVAVKLDLKVNNGLGDLVAAPAEDASQIDKKTRLGRIPVRVARPGALVSSLSVPVLGEAPKVDEIGQKESVIIQSGDLIYIPVTYTWPRSSTAGFGLDANGHLSSISHKQSGAPAQTIAKAVDSVADAVDKIRKSDFEKLKEENDELTARKTNAELKAALNPKPASPEKLELDAVQSELTLKKAKLELVLIDRWLGALSGTR